MTLTYGFFNSVDGDRKYHAEQMTSIFDGVITDGVFASIGHKFTTIPGTGMQVIVQSGRAWFNHTWTLNDGNYTLNIDAADSTLTRIDSVILEVDHNNSVRGNSIKVLKGTAASSAKAPTITNVAGALKTQYRLANITVSPKVTSITSDKIAVTVGQSECPLVTSVLKQTDITELYKNWNAQFTNSLNEMKNEFDTWFADIQTKLSEKVITNLQQQITTNKNSIDSLTTKVTANTNALSSKFDATVGHATDAEVTTGTVTNKWVSPSQLTTKIVSLKPTVVLRTIAKKSIPNNDNTMTIKPITINYPKGTKYLIFLGNSIDAYNNGDISKLSSAGLETLFSKNIPGLIYRDFLNSNIMDASVGGRQYHASGSILNIDGLVDSKLYPVYNNITDIKPYANEYPTTETTSSSTTQNTNVISIDGNYCCFMYKKSDTSMTLYPCDRVSLASTGNFGGFWNKQLGDITLSTTDGSVTSMNISYTHNVDTDNTRYYKKETSVDNMINYNILLGGVELRVNSSTNIQGINDSIEYGNVMLPILAILNGYSHLTINNVWFGSEHKDITKSIYLMNVIAI